jgi:hypothetical protein
LKLTNTKVQIHKTPNKRFEANKHKAQIHKTPTKKRNSTNHSTPNKERIHNYPKKIFEARDSN